MEYEKFKEIWDKYITNGLKSDRQILIVDEGLSPSLIDALLKVADGDNNGFDKIQHLLDGEK